MVDRIVYSMGKTVVWTDQHNDMFIVYKSLDKKIENHLHHSYRTCTYCDSLNSIVHGILDFMDILDQEQEAKYKRLGDMQRSYIWY